jgi:AcrR family transcriptional regulator
MGLEDRRRREKENRKSAILKAARKLFFEKGFKSVTVENIAQKAELSKGSVYLYFKSKEEIYTYILLTDIEKFHRKIDEMLPQGQSAAVSLKKYANIYIDIFLNDKELFRMLMSFMLNTDQMNLPDGLNNNLIKMTNKTVIICEKILQAGIEKGEFPPTINLRLTRNAVWGLLNGVISLYIMTGPVSLREERIRSTVESGLNTFIRGLKSECPERN